MKKFGLAALAIAFVLTGCAEADDTKKEGGKQVNKDDKFKLPDLDSKEWKEVKGGLKIWDVKVGTGEAVKPGAEVTVHYTGWLKDGTVFDSSVKRGEPFTSSLNQVVKGWGEGIPGMKPGGKRLLNIPYEMAYGAGGRPPVIPAKADLIFEVELIK